MALTIIENHSDCGVNIRKIIERIIKHAPPDCLDGLEEILILNKDPADTSFAKYDKIQKRIEIYIDGIVGWQPWLLKKSYIFPYLTVGMALGHEIDHHVNRNNKAINKEKSAEKNALKYVYPSMGIFKPLVKIFSFIFKKK